MQYLGIGIFSSIAISIVLIWSIAIRIAKYKIIAILIANFESIAIRIIKYKSIVTIIANYHIILESIEISGNIVKSIVIFCVTEIF